jgi:hypothetical protein
MLGHRLACTAQPWPQVTCLLVGTTVQRLVYTLECPSDVRPVLLFSDPSNGEGRGGRSGRGRSMGSGGDGGGGQEGRAAASLPPPWGTAAATPGSSGGFPALRLGTPTEAESRAALLAVCPTAPPSACPARLVAAAGSGPTAAAIAAAGPGVAFAPAVLYADVAVGWLAAGLEDHLTLEVDWCFPAGMASAAGPLPVCHVRLCSPPARLQPGTLGGAATAGAAPAPSSRGDQKASRGGGRGGGRSHPLGSAVGQVPAPEPTGPEPPTTGPQQQQQQGPPLLPPPRPLVPQGSVAQSLAGLGGLLVRGSRTSHPIMGGQLGTASSSLAVIDHALLDHLAEAVGGDGDEVAGRGGCPGPGQKMQLEPHLAEGLVA